MARNVFRWGELPLVQDKVIIKPPYEAEVTEEELKKQAEELMHPAEEYDGPTAADLKQEADAFRIDFELEKQQIEKAARDEADIIFEETQQQANDLLAKAQEDVEVMMAEAQEKSNKLLADARKKIKDEKSDAKKDLNELIGEATEKGRLEGHNQGFEQGGKEVDRLISKVHMIVGGIVSKRKEILEDSEAEVIELVLQIASRVVKVITESQKDVVIQNVRAALARVKSRTDIIIRVNMEDLELATEKMQEFQKKVEKVKNISILEDATVDRGGAIVETDFGHIDARISSQLREIETRIRELSPIKTVEDA